MDGALVNAQSKKGVSALHAACINGRENICQLLLDHGADACIIFLGPPDMHVFIMYNVYYFFFKVSCIIMDNMLKSLKFDTTQQGTNTILDQGLQDMMNSR